MAGSREDPHAQARSARSAPVLLHSMSIFREIFEIVFARRGIRTVVEIGVESGQVSGIYAELGASDVYCVDPEPTERVRSAVEANDALHLVTEPSPEVLPRLPVADLYVLDGDHNYAVVRREVAWILEHAPDAVVAMHDLLWPWGRRDLYYEPSPLKAGDRHPISEDGPTVWHDELTPAGFVGLGAFTVARHAGGERNGVLTAVEDALAEHPEWRFELVPAVFGMGILYRAETDPDEALQRALRPYTTSNLLAAMENNRIALYTRVLQMQFEAAAQADDRDRLADTVAAQRHEIDRLTAELHRAWAVLRSG
ncbi:class I SAM-dependent methyltransferase [Amycolatopsis umgeniensis]|nr:class I SAM-dependent methyltransferase [Amycolatopsis umgeniensis]